MFNDIHVIHVTAGSSGQTAKREVLVNRSPELVEQVIYYRLHKGFPGKILSYYQWIAAHRDAIREYIKVNGKPDIVHVHVPYKAGIFAIWLKRKYNIPYVITEHWGIYNDVERLNYAGRSAAFKRTTRSIFSNAAAFTSVSQFLAEGVNRLVVKKDYIVIPNVVNTDLFKFSGISGKPFRFIHVSNMVPLKNPAGILRAFKKLLEIEPLAELVMVGDREPGIRAFALALQLPASSLQFRGEILYDQVALEMQQSQCLLLFSDIENAPCVIGEALCCGLPVIATETGGIPERLNNSNGILVPPANEAALTDAMLRMIRTYSNYDQKKIATEAAGHFSYQVVGKQFSDVYSAISNTGN